MNQSEHLAQADQHICDAERRITEQERRVAELETAGRDASEGIHLLDLLRSTLVQLHIHRRAIIADLGAELAGAGSSKRYADERRGRAKPASTSAD